MRAGWEEIVKQEEQARQASDSAASIRLAGDFHLALAEMADNFLLHRYLAETVSRCSVILAVHSRPHSDDCAISEHRQIIERLSSGSTGDAVDAMDAHIDAIVQRAALDIGARPPAPLSEVLGRYAAELELRPAPKALVRKFRRA